MLRGTRLTSFGETVHNRSRWHACRRRAHLVGGVEYASLMLVDVVAIPPSGSPFFQFVQDNPDVLGGLPAYIHTAIVRA